MVKTLHRIAVASGVCGFSLVLCQCETQRTVKSTRTSISFDQQMWGGQGGGADAGKLRNKFAEKGFSINEDGSIKADNPDLYADDTARGLDGKFGKKQAKFRKTEARTKEFRTPEYIKRQQFAGADSARESGQGAREGNFNQSRDRASGRLFQRSSETTSSLASFETGRNASEGNQFATSSDRVATEGMRNSAQAEGVRQGAGYKANAGLSVGDVKKLLNPGSYAEASGISN
ncbi:MAG: hypothetical protein AAGC68_09815 [Verrucomicrobiota bacterium]